MRPWYSIVVLFVSVMFVFILVLDLIGSKCPIKHVRRCFFLECHICSGLGSPFCNYKMLGSNPLAEFHGGSFLEDQPRHRANYVDKTIIQEDLSARLERLQEEQATRLPARAALSFLARACKGPRQLRPLWPAATSMDWWRHCAVSWRKESGNGGDWWLRFSSQLP